MKNKHIETFGLIVLLASLYISTGLLSLKLLHGVTIVNLGVFAPEGIALGFALWFGSRVIPGIFIGQFILAYLSGIHIFSAVEISIINSIEALIAITLFEHFKISRNLKELKDIIWLVVIIMFVLQVFSSIFGSLALWIHSDSINGKLFATIFYWWFGNVMAQILFTPFLLILFTHYKKIDFKDYIFYGVSFGLYSCCLELIISNPFLLLVLNLPILIYILTYKGIIYGTFMSLVLAMVTSYSIYIGNTVFYANSIEDAVINYNLFVLLYTLIVLLLGSLLEEKKQYEKSLKIKIEDELSKNKEQQLMMLQQSRLAQMGEMISMIAHQWRQPLNNLSLVNQLIISKYKKGKLNDEGMEYFKINSKKQIELMSTTIDDFRNFFKNEQNQIDFDVKETISNILDMTKPIYTGSGIKIELQANDNTSYKAVGYPNALAQAILNIINNAKDALVDNEDVDDKKIFIFLKYQDDAISISILDNAGGIPDDIIDNIFDPYFSTKQEKNGTGLGLYMSKMIIEEQMNAKIYVANEKYGAKFTIDLKRENDVNK